MKEAKEKQAQLEAEWAAREKALADQEVEIEKMQLQQVSISLKFNRSSYLFCHVLRQSRVYTAAIEKCEIYSVYYLKSNSIANFIFSCSAFISSNIYILIH